MRRLVDVMLQRLLPAPSEVPGRAPCVVMFVLNDARFDTRVRKEAEAVARLGARVHVIALDRRNAPVVERLPGFTIHRVRPRPARWSGLLLLLAACALLPYRGRSDSGESFLWRALAGVVATAFAIMEAVQNLLTGAIRFLRTAAREARHGVRATVDALRRAAAILCRRLRPWLRPAAPAVGWFRRVRRRVRRWARLRVRALSRRTRNLNRRLRRLFRRRPRSPRRAWWRSWIAVFARGLQEVLPRSFAIHGINLQMARRAARLRPDVVVSHDCNTLVAGMAIKGRFGCPLVYDSHELYLERNIKAKSRRWDRLQWAPIEAIGFRMVDRAMTVAEGIARHLERQYRRRRVELVRNTPPFAEPIAPSGDLRRSLGIPSDRALVLYCGAVTFNRGLEELIEASTRLRHASIAVVGPASQPTFLERLKEIAAGRGALGSSIHFVDPVPPDQVQRLLSECDFTVVPTVAACRSYEFEASNKMFASIMAGKPIVMSDHIEKRLLQERYSIGCLVPEGDVVALATAIDRLAADRALLAHLSEQCLRAAPELHWGADVARLDSIFRPLLWRASRRRPGTGVVTQRPLGAAP